MRSAGNKQSRGRGRGRGRADFRRLGRYDLIARIGKGGMAQVYLARQRGPTHFEKLVVVKTIHPHLAAQKTFIDMLLDEARIAALLKHPCVVDIYDLGVERGTYFIAMEYLSGESLLALLHAARASSQELSIAGTCRIIADVADGLHAAHELRDHSGRSLDLVHRDITPGNIVVLYDGRVKIVDFGIAKAKGRIANQTDTRKVKGKLGYVAPESILGRPADRRVDVFSLGVVLWESLTYRRLFRGNKPSAVLSSIMRQTIDPPSKLRPDVPAQLDAICLRALTRNPDERYATVAEMQAELEDFLTEQGSSMMRRSLSEYMNKLFDKEIEERAAIIRDMDSKRQRSQAEMRADDAVAIPDARLGANIATEEFDVDSADIVEETQDDSDFVDGHLSDGDISDGSIETTASSEPTARARPARLQRVPDSAARETPSGTVAGRHSEDDETARIVGNKNNIPALSLRTSGHADGDIGPGKTAVRPAARDGVRPLVRSWRIEQGPDDVGEPVGAYAISEHSGALATSTASSAASPTASSAVPGHSTTSASGTSRPSAITSAPTADLAGKIQAARVRSARLTTDIPIMVSSPLGTGDDNAPSPQVRFAAEGTRTVWPMSRARGSGNEQNAGRDTADEALEPTLTPPMLAAEVVSPAPSAIARSVSKSMVASSVVSSSAVPHSVALIPSHEERRIVMASSSSNQLAISAVAMSNARAVPLRDKRNAMPPTYLQLIGLGVSVLSLLAIALVVVINDGGSAAVVPNVLVAGERVAEAAEDTTSMHALSIPTRQKDSDLAHGSAVLTSRNPAQVANEMDEAERRSFGAAKDSAVQGDRISGSGLQHADGAARNRSDAIVSGRGKRGELDARPSDNDSADANDSEVEEAVSRSRRRGRKERDSKQEQRGADAKRARGLYDDGVASYVRGDLLRAEQSLRQALSIRPNNARTHRALGMVYERIGDNQRAVEEFRTYLRLRPRAKDRRSIRNRIAALRE